MSADLRTLIATYERVEGEMKIRANMLETLEKQITAIVAGVGPSLIKELGIELPATISNSRQRLSNTQVAEVFTAMRKIAERSVTFTRPELLSVVSEQFSHVSDNILNRIFGEQEFDKVGTRENERGNPIVYRCHIV